MELRFVESGFRGLLPSFFEGFHGIPEGVNDLNLFFDRFVPVDSCDFVVDSLVGDRGDDDWTRRGWNVVHCLPFLDGAHTPMLTRAFWLGPKTWLDYCVYKKGST